MPNRKTFDDREKYDHSAHRSGGPEQGDLAAVPNSPTQRDDAQRYEPQRDEPQRDDAQRNDAEPFGEKADEPAVSYKPAVDFPD